MFTYGAQPLPTVPLNAVPSTPPPLPPKEISGYAIAYFFFLKACALSKPVKTRHSANVKWPHCTLPSWFVVSVLPLVILNSYSLDNVTCLLCSGKDSVKKLKVSACIPRAVLRLCTSGIQHSFLVKRSSTSHYSVALGLQGCYWSLGTGPHGQVLLNSCTSFKTCDEGCTYTPTKQSNCKINLHVWTAALVSTTVWSTD